MFLLLSEVIPVASEELLVSRPVLVACDKLQAQLGKLPCPWSLYIEIKKLQMSHFYC